MLAAGWVVTLSAAAFNAAGAESKSTNANKYDNGITKAYMQRAVKKHPALKAKLRGNFNVVIQPHFKKFVAAHPMQERKITRNRNIME